MNITFVDAQQMMLKHPDTFEAPTKEELDAIKIDDSVKICVEEWGERFWITVKEINGNDIVGVIDNDLMTDEMGYGDEMKIQKQHIYSIF